MSGWRIDMGKQEIATAEKLQGPRISLHSQGPWCVFLPFGNSTGLLPPVLGIYFPEDGSQQLQYSTHKNADLGALGGGSQMCLPVKWTHRWCLRHAAKQVFARLCQPRFLFSLLSDASLCTIC